MCSVLRFGPPGVSPFLGPRSKAWHVSSCSQAGLAVLQCSGHKRASENPEQLSAPCNANPEAFVCHGGVLVQPLWLQICLLRCLNQCGLTAAVEGSVVIVKHALLTPNCLPHITQPKPVFLCDVAVSAKSPWKDPSAQQGAGSKEGESQCSLCESGG